MGRYRIRDIFTNPSARFSFFRRLGVYDRLSDEQYIKRAFKARMGYELDLTNPKTFNEKLQWLKLYDRKPEYTTMVDKYAAKEYVAGILDKEYIIPTLGVWDSFDEVDFDRLPDQFVLKCTHDSGGLVICRDKSVFDYNKARNIITKSLANDYYLKEGREWPYKDVPRRIIAEKYMQDGNNRALRDYKFYCFDGSPKFLYLSEGLENHSTARISFVNMDWTFASFGRSDFTPFDTLPKKPEQFDEMVQIAKTLSAGIPFLRVDLYVINGKIYFGELTFSPCGGMMPFAPPEADARVGEYLDLPELGSTNNY